MRFSQHLILLVAVLSALYVVPSSAIECKQVTNNFWPKDYATWPMTKSIDAGYTQYRWYIGIDYNDLVAKGKGPFYPPKEVINTAHISTWNNEHTGYQIVLKNEAPQKGGKDPHYKYIYSVALENETHYSWYLSNFEKCTFIFGATFSKQPAVNLTWYL